MTNLRWRVLLAATGLMMCIGTAYSWSLFTRPLMAFYGWTSVQVGFAFALMVFGIGIGALAGGILHDRIGARPVGLAGAALWGSGFLLAGLGLPHLGLRWLYLTYGLIGGFGGGMAYVVPGACVTRWFQKNRGLANGVVLFGFGAGSLIFNNVVAAIPSFARTADAANRIVVSRNAALSSGAHLIASQSVDAAGRAAIASVFVGAGIVLIAVGVLCALGLTAPSASPSLASESVHEYPPREMLRTPTFYVIWTLVFVDCFAGLAVLGNAVPMYSELTGATATVATLVYGWLSIFNGVGRLLWAWISDAVGRIGALVAAFALEGAALAVLPMAHAAVLVSVVLAVAFLCFGGIIAIAPAIIADYYGTRYLGEDYGYVITAASVAGLAGPLLFSLVEDATGSLTRTIVPIGVAVAVTAFLPFAARSPGEAPSSRLAGANRGASRAIDP